MLLRYVEQALPRSYRHSNSGSLRVLVAERLPQLGKDSSIPADVTAEDLAQLTGSSSIGAARACLPVQTVELVAHRRA